MEIKPKNTIKTDDIESVIVIPKGATNGDVICTLFPFGIPKDVTWTLQGDKGLDWWNAPYKRSE